MHQYGGGEDGRSIKGGSGLGSSSTAPQATTTAFILGRHPATALPTAPLHWSW
jgi:hypothetical protein